MKKTVQVNIGGVAFIVDDDAYATLARYFDDIRSRLVDPDPDEVIADIEARVAEIFSERVNPARQVVDLGLVRQAMAIIGRADAFGERRYDFAQTPPPYTGANGRNSRKRLMRSSSNKVLAGVCGGIADYLDVDPLVVRILTLILVIAGGLSIWIYLILWLVLPLDNNA